MFLLSEREGGRWSFEKKMENYIGEYSLANWTVCGSFADISGNEFRTVRKPSLMVVCGLVGKKFFLQTVCGPSGSQWVLTLLIYLSLYHLLVPQVLIYTFYTFVVGSIKKLATLLKTLRPTRNYRRQLFEWKTHVKFVSTMFKHVIRL